MFSDIKEALFYIESKRNKRTLEQFKETILKYNFNINQKNIIHIAGTNGKGSTTKFISNILIKHGYHVGTFTSPYLICHNDRICIDGQMISDEDLLRIINELYSIIEDEKLSMFEIDTLIMLKYFDENDLNYRIIETGIGGLNDKTNVVNSICSVITNIGYDHQFMLGDTLESIAKNKAGIIKDYQTCFIGDISDDLKHIFKDVCDSKHTDLIALDIQCDYSYPYHYNYYGYDYYLKDCGRYQINNSSLAIAVCDSLIPLNETLVQMALDEFVWPGRFEKFGKIYLDGAHNIDGVKVLLETIDDYHLEDVLVIFSALGDKDIGEMKELLSKYPLLQVTFDDERMNLTGINYKEAINQNIDKYENIVITGSLHFISEVRNYIKESL